MNPKILCLRFESVDVEKKIVYTNAKFIIDESIKFGQEGYWRFYLQFSQEDIGIA